MSAEQDFNLKVTVRNARLLRRIRERFGTTAQMARECEIQPNAINALVTMRSTPYNKNGTLGAAAEKVCAALGCYPDEIWPEWVAKIKLAKATTEVEMSGEQVAAFMSSESTVMHRDLLEKISVDLNERERLVIAMRKDGCTLDEVGSEINGRSVERVRQIEQKAMRKMRRRAQLLGFRPGQRMVK